MGLIVEHNGKKFEVDNYGFLYDFFQYSDEDMKDWYDFVRIKYVIPELTSEHFKVLKSLQDYFRNNGMNPLIKKISTQVKMNTKSIIKLFPSYEAMIMMAGLPRPWGDP